jgi:hypothetical protein
LIGIGLVVAKSAAISGASSRMDARGGARLSPPGDSRQSAKLARAEVRRDADQPVAAERERRQKEMVVAAPESEARGRGRARKISENCAKSPLDSLTPATFAWRRASSSSVAGQHVRTRAPGMLYTITGSVVASRDRAEVREHAVLRRFVVVGHDREDAVDAECFARSVISTEWRVLLPPVPATTAARSPTASLTVAKSASFSSSVERRRFARRAADDEPVVAFVDEKAREPRRGREIDRRRSIERRQHRGEQRADLGRAERGHREAPAVISGGVASCPRPEAEVIVNRLFGAATSSSGTSTEIVMFESVEWMISTPASVARARRDT